MLPEQVQAGPLNLLEESLCGYAVAGFLLGEILGVVSITGRGGGGAGCRHAGSLPRLSSQELTCMAMPPRLGVTGQAAWELSR